MTYLQLAYMHLGTVVPAFFLGTWLLFIGKQGTKLHKLIGKIYMLLMLFTAFLTLFMNAQVGPALFNHFGFIHLFSFLVLFSVPRAFLAARRKNISAHKKEMYGLYIGGILIAGGVAFFPGRLLNSWIF